MINSLLQYIVTIPLVVGVALSFHKKKWIYSCVGISLSMFIMAIIDNWNKPLIGTSYGVLLISFHFYKAQQAK